MIRSPLFASLTVIAVLGGTAIASPAAAARAYSEGKQKYAAGEYALAATYFRTAFAEDPDPAYLFNLAQALRLAKDCDAAQMYRKFLDEVPDARNRAEIEGYLRDLERCGEQQKRPPPPEPVVMPPPASAAPPSIDSPAKPRSRTLPIALGVVGVVALGVGAYFAHDAGVAADEYERVCTEPGCVWGPEHDARLEALDRRGRRGEVLGTSLLAVGGAAAITATVLWFWPQRSSATSKLAVVPTGDGALAVGTLRF